MSFTRLRLHQSLLEQLATLGYDRPSPIQNQFIPAVLDQRDVLSYARDGSGQCDALLQATIHQQYSQPTDSITHIILTPTSEHASWLNGRLQRLSGGSVRTRVIAGSGNTDTDEKPTLIIATPDHLAQAILQDNLHLKHLSMLALDNADQFTALGLQPVITKIASGIPTQRQTIILGTTPSAQIAAISEELQQSPLKLSVSPSKEDPSGIAQRAWPVPRHLKIHLLLRFLTEFNVERMILIVEGYKFGMQLSRKLRARKFSVGVILNDNWGDKQLMTLDQFQSGAHQILVITGIISPRIKIHKITHVTHYDLPSDPQTYFANLQTAPEAMFINLVTAEDEQCLLDVENRLGRPIRRDKFSDFDYSAPPTTTSRVSRTSKRSDKSKAAKDPQTTTSRVSGPSKRNDKSKAAKDPQTPLTWGDRNAPRKAPDKIPLDKWSPGPLPDIWKDNEQLPSKGKSTKRNRRRSRSRSRRRRT